MLKRISPDRLRTIDPQRICVIKPSALGDVVQSLPLVGALRIAFPDARLAWVINHNLLGLVDDYPGLDEAIPFDRHGGPRASWALLRGLRRRRFDLVFDLQGLLRTGMMTSATGAAIRVGLQTAREASHLACNLTVPGTGSNIPAHARYRCVADLLHANMPWRFSLPISGGEAEWAAEQLAHLPQPLIAVHAGARWETKRWPVDKFAQIVIWAVRTFGCGIVIIGSPAERRMASALKERFLAEASHADGAIRDLTGQTTLKQLAAVLQIADVMLANDSGPMHLGAALGTPVVGLFTCTDPLRSGPSGQEHILISSQLPCAASYQKTCPHHGTNHLACFDELSVERVWHAVSTLLTRQVQQRDRSA